MVAVSRNQNKNKKKHLKNKSIDSRHKLGLKQSGGSKGPKTAKPAVSWKLKGSITGPAKPVIGPTSSVKLKTGSTTTFGQKAYVPVRAIGSLTKGIGAAVTSGLWTPVQGIGRAIKEKSRKMNYDSAKYKMQELLGIHKPGYFMRGISFGRISKGKQRADYATIKDDVEKLKNLEAAALKPNAPFDAQKKLVDAQAAIAKKLKDKFGYTGTVNQDTIQKLQSGNNVVKLLGEQRVKDETAAAQKQIDGKKVIDALKKELYDATVSGDEAKLADIQSKMEEAQTSINEAKKTFNVNNANAKKRSFTAAANELKKRQGKLEAYQQYRKASGVWSNYGKNVKNAFVSGYEKPSSLLAGVTGYNFAGNVLRKAEKSFLPFLARRSTKSTEQLVKLHDEQLQKADQLTSEYTDMKANYKTLRDRTSSRIVNDPVKSLKYKDILNLNNVLDENINIQMQETDNIRTLNKALLLLPTAQRAGSVEQKAVQDAYERFNKANAIINRTQAQIKTQINNVVDKNDKQAFENIITASNNMQSKVYEKKAILEESDRQYGDALVRRMRKDTAVLESSKITGLRNKAIATFDTSSQKTINDLLKFGKNVDETVINSADLQKAQDDIATAANTVLESAKTATGENKKNLVALYESLKAQRNMFGQEIAKRTNAKTLVDVENIKIASATSLSALQSQAGKILTASTADIDKFDIAKQLKEIQKERNSNYKMTQTPATIAKIKELDAQATALKDKVRALTETQDAAKIQKAVDDKKIITEQIEKIKASQNGLVLKKQSIEETEKQLNALKESLDNKMPKTNDDNEELIKVNAKIKSNGEELTKVNADIAKLGTSLTAAEAAEKLIDKNLKDTEGARGSRKNFGSSIQMFDTAKAEILKANEVIAKADADALRLPTLKKAGTPVGFGGIRFTPDENKYNEEVDINIKQAEIRKIDAELEKHEADKAIATDKKTLISNKLAQYTDAKKLLDARIGKLQPLQAAIDTAGADEKLKLENEIKDSIPDPTTISKGNPNFNDILAAEKTAQTNTYITTGEGVAAIATALTDFGAEGTEKDGLPDGAGGTTRRPITADDIDAERTRKTNELTAAFERNFDTINKDSIIPTADLGAKDVATLLNEEKTRLDNEAVSAATADTNTKVKTFETNFAANTYPVATVKDLSQLSDYLDKQRLIDGTIGTLTTARGEEQNKIDTANAAIGNPARTNAAGGLVPATGLLANKTTEADELTRLTTIYKTNPFHNINGVAPTDDQIPVLGGGSRQTNHKQKKHHKKTKVFRHKQTKKNTNNSYKIQGKYISKSKKHNKSNKSNKSRTQKK